MTEAVLERVSGQPQMGEEDLRQYIADIRGYPLLRPEQELELARRRDSGEEEAVQTLVNSNLRLVVAIAREYAGRGVPLLDLIQEGSIGLIVAAKKFDQSRGLRFSTYASKWIRQRVGRSLENHSSAIRVPAHTAQRMRQIAQAQQAFQLEHGREPDVAELAAWTELSEEKVRQLLLLDPQICSLDAPAGEESTVGGLLPDDGEYEPQAVLIRQEMKGILDALLARLDPRQREILALRFGMADGVCHSFEQISPVVGVSKERVRQIEAQAIKRLNKLGAELGLEDFLE